MNSLIQTRHCIQCSTEIQECMGSVIASDFLKAMFASSSCIQVREICGKCTSQMIIHHETEERLYEIYCGSIESNEFRKNK